MSGTSSIRSADVGFLPGGGGGIGGRGGLKLLTIKVLVKSVSPESGARMRQESDGLASTSSRPNTVLSRPDDPLIPEVLPSQKLKKKKGKIPLKLPNDSNTKTLNTHARARTRARIHIEAHARAHTLRVCYSHHCRQSLTRATRLPLPLPGYRAWVCGGGGEARRLRITGRSRGAAQGGAHGFWARCALPEGQPGPLARILCSPFPTGLGASSLAHSLIPNLQIL